MRCLATNVVLLALAALQPSFAAAKRRHLRGRYLPSDLDDARETDDTIEWDDTTIEDDTRVVGPRWRRRPYGVIDDDGWAGDGEPVDPGAELALVLFLVIVIFWLAVHFHVRLRAGPARAGSAPRSPLCSLLPCEPRAAGCCMSAELGGAYFSSSFRCMLVVPRANRSFRVVFEFSRC